LLTGLVYADTKDVYYNTASDYTVSDSDEIVVDNGSSGLAELLPIEINSSHSLWGNVISVWHMNNDAWDDPKGGNDGVLGGDPSFSDTDKMLGSDAGSFDGDDYVSIPEDDTSLDISTDMTVSAWVKSGSSGTIISKCTNGNRAWYFNIWSDGGIIIYISEDGGSVNRWYRQSSIKTVNDNQWHHVAFTLESSNTLNVYVDGALSNGTLEGNPSSIHINDVKVTIGGWEDSGGFNGLIDEVAIFNKALNLAEIQSLISYPQDKPYVKYDAGSVWQPMNLDSLNSIIPSGVVGTVEYSFEINGTDKWWNKTAGGGTGAWETNSGELREGDDLYDNPAGLVSVWHMK
jgi:hypothetical protein